jgi:hypothetical protein
MARNAASTVRPASVSSAPPPSRPPFEDVTSGAENIAFIASTSSQARL